MPVTSFAVVPSDTVTVPVVVCVPSMYSGVTVPLTVYDSPTTVGASVQPEMVVFTPLTSVISVVVLALLTV